VLGRTGSRREWALATAVSVVAVTGMVTALVRVVSEGAPLPLLL
jgi:hypothetical protein